MRTNKYQFISSVKWIKMIYHWKSKKNGNCTQYKKISYLDKPYKEFLESMIGNFEFKFRKKFREF